MIPVLLTIIYAIQITLAIFVVHLSNVALQIIMRLYNICNS